jgi:hypothetical protein
MNQFLLCFALIAASALAEDVWGGPGIQMTVGPQGATVELDCAHGAIDGPIAVGSDGRFRAAGTYAAEHGGPVREGEDTGRSAMYEGRVEGKKKLTLVIKVGEEEVGTFELVQGRSGRITKCL